MFSFLNVSKVNILVNKADITIQDKKKVAVRYSNDYYMYLTKAVCHLLQSLTT